MSADPHQIGSESGEDGVPDPAMHLPDDRFIPIRPGDLAEAISRDSIRFGPEAAHLRALERELEDVIEQEAASCERSLAKLYAPLNPDRDTIVIGDEADAAGPVHQEVNRWLAYLLDKANFERLDEVGLEAVVRQAGNASIKIRIRPERIDHLDLWVRGKSTATRRARTWRAPIAGVPREVGVYRRLAVVGRLRGESTVFIKIFREIPFTDVEALLPHAEIRMSFLDRVKVWGGGAGALGGVAGKLVQGVLFATSISKLAWLLIVPLGAMAVRSFMGYRTARIHRESQRTRNLYYQNLASNAAAIHMLVALIAQEEIKEALVAYGICMARSRRGAGIECEEEIGGEARDYLTCRFGVDVDYDVHDGLETLDRLGLRVGPPGARRLLPIEEAVARMAEHWRARRSEGYHEASVRTRTSVPTLKGTRWA